MLNRPEFDLQNLWEKALFGWHLWREEGADVGTGHIYSSVVECFLASINPGVQPQYGEKVVRGNKAGKSMQKKDGPVVPEMGLESQGWQATTRSQEGPRMMAEG